MSSAAPGGPVPAGGSSTGLDPRVASVVAYSAWWVTGLVFLALERSDESVRFHAAQSVVVFGLASAVIAAAFGAALPLMLVSGDAAQVLMAVANLTWLAAVGLWAWLVFKAASGERWCVPGLAPLVAALARRSPAATPRR
jgi:uncharacterized membrane protein